jgi:hypothetical protein
MHWKASMAALALAACSRERVAVVVATFEVPAATAAPRVSSAEELPKAEGLVVRVFTSSLIRAGPSDSLTTYRLQRHRDRALLTIDARTRDVRHKNAPWSPARTETYVGSVEPKGTAVKLKLVHGTDTMALLCAPEKLSVASASAVLMTGGSAFPSEFGTCTRPACFVPQVTKSIEVLRCTSRESLEHDDSEVVDWEDLLFAPAPGVEHVMLNADTTGGTGWREVPADGSVKPIEAE